MRRLLAAIRIIAVALVGVGAMALLMYWLSGGFVEKVAPAPPAPLPPQEEGLPVETVSVVEVPAFREVVGTITAEHETNVSSMLLGRVVEVNATAGQEVQKGDVLVRLDESEYKARVAQAEAALREAEDRYRRLKRMFEDEVGTERDLVQAETALEGARGKLEEAKTYLGYTVARSPVHGVVIDRYCEVGDTVSPNTRLVRLFDRLQLLATVPESLRSRLHVGQRLQVRVDALDAACEGRVAEIVAETETVARAFQVKVQGPCKAGLMPGMFGRLRIPLEPRREMRIPAAAVRRVGQLPMVFRLTEEGGTQRRFVRLGAEHDDRVVVLSGLAPGERIYADAGRVRRGAP